MGGRELLPFLFLVLISVSTPICIVEGAVASHLITHGLPGQPFPSSFKQYSGYVSVDSVASRFLFYYFVEAAELPHSKPLTLWLNGGPGCSSVGIGAFMENGPFRATSANYSTIVLNDYSWNKESNILYLDSPAGVGWSYSNKTSDYNTNDALTAKDNLVFLLNWFELFEEYKSNNFFITGESYAGHYVPQLAELVVEHNKKQGKTLINLKGIAIGNPLLYGDVDFKERPNYLWSHGVISDETYYGLTKSCGYLNGKGEDMPDCSKFKEEGSREEGQILDSHDILSDACLSSSDFQETKMMNWMMGKSMGGEMGGLDACIENGIVGYFNLVEVQKAFHANITHLSYSWSPCSDSINYDPSKEDGSMLPTLQHLLQAGLRVLVYSGDEDSVLPFSATRRLVHDLAMSMQFNVTHPYRPWFLNKQIAGWGRSYNGSSLAFATVRGAGHTVPFTNPEQALLLFKNFLDGKPFPSS